MKKMMAIALVALFSTSLFAGAMSEIDLGTRESIEGYFYKKGQSVSDIWDLGFSQFNDGQCRFYIEAKAYVDYQGTFNCLVCYQDVDGYRRPQNMWATCEEAN
jgi:hypothetical protein